MRHIGGMSYDPISGHEFNSKDIWYIDVELKTMTRIFTLYMFAREMQFEIGVGLQSIKCMEMLGLKNIINVCHSNNKVMYC